MSRTLTTLALSLTALLGSTLWCAPSTAQGDDVTDREGFRLTAGAGIAAGFLDFRSDTVLLQANLGGIPTHTVGVEGWISETAGFDLAYQFSYGGTLQIPLETLNGENEIAFVTHRLEGAFHYRWFLSDSPSALALGLRAGFLLHAFVPSPHAPTIVLSTSYAGPLLGITADLPITDIIGIEGDLNLLFPFNVREFPDVSGQPKGPTGFAAGGGPWLRVLHNVYLKARFDYRVFSVSYDGRGNRGLGNVTNGESYDGFQSAQVLIDWIP
jgi:hypothetical protein